MLRRLDAQTWVAGQVGPEALDDVQPPTATLHAGAASGWSVGAKVACSNTEVHRPSASVPAQALRTNMSRHHVSPGPSVRNSQFTSVTLPTGAARLVAVTEVRLHCTWSGSTVMVPVSVTLEMAPRA